MEEIIRSISIIGIGLMVLMMAVCLYFLWRNERVCRFRIWFNHKCHDWCVEDVMNREYPDANEIIGTYDYLLYNYRSFERMVKDKKRYAMITKREQG